MGAKKTAGNPPFTGLLQERGPKWVKVSGKVQLSSEPLRVDDVIEVWASLEHDPDDVGTTLRGMWRFVVVVALLEYKSVVIALSPGHTSFGCSPTGCSGWPLASAAKSDPTVRAPRGSRPTR